MIFTSAFTFRPIVGAFAGGVGSSLADVGSVRRTLRPHSRHQGIEVSLRATSSEGNSRKKTLLVSGRCDSVVGSFLVVAFLYLPQRCFPNFRATYSGRSGDSWVCQCRESEGTVATSLKGRSMKPPSKPPKNNRLHADHRLAWLAM